MSKWTIQEFLKDCVVAMINIFLYPFLLNVFKIQNDTNNDFIVTMSFPEAGCIFQHDVTFADWDLFVLQKGERQYFTRGFLRNPKHQWQLSYMLSGIAVYLYNPSFLLQIWPASLKITDNNGSLSFQANGGLAVRVSKAQLIRKNSSGSSKWEWNPNAFGDSEEQRTANLSKFQAAMQKRMHFIEKKNAPEQEEQKTAAEVVIEDTEYHAAAAEEAGDDDTQAKADPEQLAKELTVPVRDNDWRAYVKGDFLESNPALLEASLWAVALQGRLCLDYMEEYENAFGKDYAPGNMSTCEYDPKITRRIAWYSVAVKLGKDLRKECANPTMDFSKYEKSGDPVDYLKIFADKAIDFYNEYVLLIIALASGETEPIVFIFLVLTSISLSLANAVSSAPEEAPGRSWWGVGPGNEPNDKGIMFGGMYVDCRLRAGVPLLMSALISLATFGKQTEVTGWENIAVSATSQAYLAWFAFALICVIENTLREEDKPLGELRQKVGWTTARLVALICQALCVCIPFAINLMVFYTPSSILFPLIGSIVFYGGIAARFVFEPSMLAVAWYRSNLRTIVLFALTIPSMLLVLVTPSKLQQVWNSYIANFLNNFLYAGIFVLFVTFTVLLYLDVLFQFE